MDVCTATFVSREEVAEGTYKYIFTKPDGFDFHAGQYAILDVDAPAFRDERPTFRSLSIASAPHEEHMAFIMRNSDSAFKKSMQALTEGDAVTLKGPLGHMTLPEDTTIPIVYLVAGVGITPARAMLLDAAHRQSQRPFTLIYSNRNVGSAACYKEMEELHLPNYTCINTMTQTCDDWGGTCGRVDAQFLREHLADVHAPTYYIVGTKGFIEGMKAALGELAIPADNMIIDNFG